MKTLSILVPSRNMSSCISLFFSFIYNGKADEDDFEVIVVDSSTDSSMSCLDELKQHPSLKVLHYDLQVKCGTARNIAAKQASGKYVYCMDIDDHFCESDTLSKVILQLKSEDKDVLYCPFTTAKCKQAKFLPEESIRCICYAPVGCWTKMYKRELYTDFPDYMPEDVAAHFMLLDKCSSVGLLKFPVYFYDNTSPSAISRTFDYMKVVPHNLLLLALTKEIEAKSLRQEYITGCMHNLADMFDLRDKLKNVQVKDAWADKLRGEFTLFMAGFIIH